MKVPSWAPRPAGLYPRLGERSGSRLVNVPEEKVGHRSPKCEDLPRRRICMPLLSCVIEGVDLARLAQ